MTYYEEENACWWPQNQYGQTYYFDEFYVDGYTDPSGTYHPLNVAVSGYPSTPCQNYPFPPSSASGAATDGSGYTVQVATSQFGPLSGSVTSISGTTVSPPPLEHGGTVTDANGNTVTMSTSGGTTTFTDTLGTTALTVSGSNPLTYTYSTTTGSASVTLKYSTYTVETSFGCPNIVEFGASQQTQEELVSEIDLPDNTKYSFIYETTPNANFPGAVTGRISSVTLPTGGMITYTYNNGTNDGINCTSGSGTYLIRTTPDGEWKYAVTGSAPSITTVTDPQSNQTVYDFEGIYQTQEQIYQGSSPGTLLKTITTCYNGNTSNCPSTAVSLPITQVAVTTQMDNGQQSKTVADYNSYGLLTKVDEYTFGQGTPGGLYRETMTCYAKLSNANILDRPSATLVYSVGGNSGDCTGTSGLAAKTTYGYDGNGNLTSLNEYFNATTTIARYFTYGSYGVLQTATDFNGNTTTFTNGDCNSAFPTSITQPLSLGSSMTWDCNTGLVTSVTDPNSQVASFSYDDLDRLTQTNNPDGGGVSTTYNDTSSPATVLTSTALGAPGTRTDTALLDGLGRVISTQLTSDPAGADKVDTTYDSLGRVASVTNPYRNTSDPTYGKTQYSYDALGRVTQVTDPDANTRQASYGSGSQLCSAATYGLGYPTLTTDEAGHQRRLFTDALGRTIEVDEPDPANGNTLDLNTCYSYDTLGDLTQVAQGAQTRTYNYDMLGRLTSAVTPESGTTTYSYSGCSGDPSNVCTRTDARGITTTYAYDALNRLTSKSYSDGTPTAYFVYDESSVDNDGVFYPTTNTKGRLSHTWVKYPDGNFSVTINSYDPMGRVRDYWQCTPYNCLTTSIWNLHYNYDLAGDIASWTHPAGFTITNTINKAQQITQITSSLFDSTHPQYLAKNITYTPWSVEASLENGCTSSSGQETGCTDTVETYAYNNRLQPVMIELGTTSNAAADYCLVYNDYASLGSPGSCAVPAQGTGDNGNVRGYLYQDNANPSLSHTEAYTYDALNRLTNAAATGSSTYNFTFQYDRWGNMTCMINGQTNGPCPEYSFNSANNQITNTGYTYDAAGDLTSDGTYTYQYDAEGRLEQVSQGSTVWAINTYNALGQRMENNEPQFDRVEYPRDPMGNHLGNYLVNAASWFNMSSPGRGLFEYEGGDTYVYHHDLLGSAKVMTGHSGGEIMDALLLPWGSIWTGLGSTGEMLFAGFQDHDVNQIWPGDHRYLNPNIGRWLTPDLLGGDIANPQSLNRYAYVLNNPTTLTDPSGLGPSGLGGGIGECPFIWCQPTCSDFFSSGTCEPPFPPSGPISPPVGFPIGGGGGGGGGSAGSSASAAPLPQAPSPFASGASAQTIEQTAPFWIQVIVEACANNPICMLAAGVDPEVVGGVAAIGLAAWEIGKLVPHIHYAHRKGARPSTKGKHQAGTSRQAKDQGGEKGDLRRRPPRKRPTGWKGPWPPPTAIVPES